MRAGLRRSNFMRKDAFTLTELIIALAILGILSLVLLPIINSHIDRGMNLAYQAEYNNLSSSLDNLVVDENAKDITGTMMYSETDIDDFENSSGAYIKKYMKVAKYCGNSPSDCFASKYYSFKNNKKVLYDINSISGACALLRNGISICLKPIIGDSDKVIGFMDVNGRKGPNIYGRDLRNFVITKEFPRDDVDTSSSAVNTVSVEDISEDNE